MDHRNKPSSFAATLLFGLCVVLGACDDQPGAFDIGDTDDYIDQDVPPGVQEIEEVECARGSICVRLTLDTGDECVLPLEDVEGATRQQLVQRCRG